MNLEGSELMGWQEREGRGRSGNIQHLRMESPKTVCTRTADCDVFVHTHIITYISMHVFNNNKRQKAVNGSWGPWRGRQERAGAGG